VFGSGGLTISGTLAATTVAAGTLTLTNPLAAVNGGTPLFVNSASTTGSANAQALATGSTIPGGYTRATGSLVVFNPGYANTGAMSLNDGLGAVNIYKQSLAGATPTGGGEVVAGQMAVSVFDGTQYQLLNAAKAAGFGLLTNLASGATTDLGLIASHFVNITGTNAISSLGSSASVTEPIYLVIFEGVLTITNNAVSLITPRGANITTKAGNYAICQFLGGSNWRILEFSYVDSSDIVVQIFATAGAYTYNPTSGCVKAHVQMQAAGGGSGGATYNSLGGIGGSTSLGSWTVIGGSGGGGGLAGAAVGGTGGKDGVNSTASGMRLVSRTPGSPGGGSAYQASYSIRGQGGNSQFGAGPGLLYQLGAAASGSGYGAGAIGWATGGQISGSGGGAESAAFWIYGPSTMTGVVGTGGLAGTGSPAGAAGTGGAVWIEEFFA
jgi:hypothetical protein